MPVSVSADGFSIVTSKSEGKAIATIPDVCKIPTSNGPVPIPFPNMAESKDLSRGTILTKIDGGSVAVMGSFISKSTGDEAGALGGVVSGCTKGKAIFMNCSQTVIAEGRPVCRKSDLMIMNNINTISMPGMMQDDVEGESAAAMEEQEKVPLKIDLSFLSEDTENETYKLKAFGKIVSEGTIGGDHKIEAEVPKSCKSGVLMVGKEKKYRTKYKISFDDFTEGDAGTQNRLTNQGFSPGRIDGRIAKKSQMAIAKFQNNTKQSVTMENDSNLINSLKSNE